MKWLSKTETETETEWERQTEPEPDTEPETERQTERQSKKNRRQKVIWGTLKITALLVRLVKKLVLTVIANNIEPIH